MADQNMLYHVVCAARFHDESERSAKRHMLNQAKRTGDLGKITRTDISAEKPGIFLNKTPDEDLPKRSAVP